jgi:hypothetical protein
MTSGVVIVGTGPIGRGSAVACARAGLSIGRLDHATGIQAGALAAVAQTPDDMASAGLGSASGGTVTRDGDLRTARLDAPSGCPDHANCCGQSREAMHGSRPWRRSGSRQRWTASGRRARGPESPTEWKGATKPLCGRWR